MLHDTAELFIDRKPHRIRKSGLIESHMKGSQHNPSRLFLHYGFQACGEFRAICAGGCSKLHSPEFLVILLLANSFRSRDCNHNHLIIRIMRS